VDYDTGLTYHMAEPGALSAAIRPIKPDGSPDSEVEARLQERHDDTQDNVANRLRLWDKHVSALPCDPWREAALPPLLVSLHACPLPCPAASLPLPPQTSPTQALTRPLPLPAARRPASRL
jgi:hypothetical protein